jgi:hypothetical protein
MIIAVMPVSKSKAKKGNVLFLLKIRYNNLPYNRQVPKRKKKNLLYLFQMPVLSNGNFLYKK